MPPEVTYNIRKLRDFVERDENAIVAFYGGEPLLRRELMEEVMDEVDAKFVLQTNGLLLRETKKKYLKKLSTILVSIDGIKEVNDFYKGEVYDRVVENVMWLSKFYDGDLIARMVASEKTDIVRDVKHLLDLNFDHVHWQINAIWSPEGLWKDFEKWIDVYNSGISELVDWWVRRIKEGSVEGIVPFLGILKALIFEPNTSPPCGAGKTSFAITTDGRITACPVCAEFEWNVVGSLDEGIRRIVDIKSPCKECDYLHVCGGRCLFFNREMLWGKKGFELVCKACRHLIEEVRKAISDVMDAVNEGLVDLRELYYPSFNNTTEIVP
jgi:putative peptide-modifying radical SAM enzyme